MFISLFTSLSFLFVPQMRFDCHHQVRAEGSSPKHAGDNEEESFLHYYTKEVIDYCYQDY